jgi:rhodanese-related sulfurtransferase
MFEEILPSAAYEALKKDADEQLIDCRSVAEWNLIGTPDLSPIDKQVACLEWQSVDGQRNESFCDKISEHIDKETAIYIICRSGARSAAACQALAAAGFTTLFNVSGGFEGNTDAQGHRATQEGWKFEGLPWRQP